MFYLFFAKCSFICQSKKAASFKVIDQFCAKYETFFDKLLQKQSEWIYISRYRVPSNRII